MKKLIFIILILLALVPEVSFSAPAINSMSSLMIGNNYQTQIPSVMALAAPTWVDNIVLVANTPVTYIIPTGAKYLLFATNGIFYANYTTIASVPAASNLLGSGSEIAPAFRSVVGLTTISLIAPVNTIVTIGVYK